MKIFNPVIDNDNPNCRCKDCFHGFWLRNLHDEKLKCYCELSHSIIFSSGHEKVSICTGAEDNLIFSDYLKENVACARCQNSLWYRTEKNITRCFCLHLQCFVYDSFNKKLQPISRCNGIEPLQDLPSFPTATSLDDF